MFSLHVLHPAKASPGQTYPGIKIASGHEIGTRRTSVKLTATRGYLAPLPPSHPLSVPCLGEISSWDSPCSARFGPEFPRPGGERMKAMSLTAARPKLGSELVRFCFPFSPLLFPFWPRHPPPPLRAGGRHVCALSMRYFVTVTGLCCCYVKKVIDPEGPRWLWEDGDICSQHVISPAR